MDLLKKENMTQNEYYEEEVDKLLLVLDSKVDRIKLNLDIATKVCDDLIESCKKFQSGLLPESELNQEKEEVLPEDDFSKEKIGDDENDL